MVTKIWDGLIKVWENKSENIWKTFLNPPRIKTMNALEVVPKKCEGIEEIRKEGSIHLVRDKRRSAATAMRFLIWAHQTSRYQRIDIEDPIGMRLWELIDGKNNVGTIAEIIGREFVTAEQFRNADKNQVITWTIQFLRMLFASKLIHY